MEECTGLVQGGPADCLLCLAFLPVQKVLTAVLSEPYISCCVLHVGVTQAHTARFPHDITDTGVLQPLISAQMAACQAVMGVARKNKTSIRNPSLCVLSANEAAQH